MTEREFRAGFQDVDRTTNPDYFVNSLDNITAMDAVRRYKQQSYELLNIGRGNRVLDIGCGVGDDLLALSEIVGTNGLAIGIDRSETMISEATKRIEAVDSSAEFRVGDAENLDFEDNYFDGCRADRVFHHLDSPVTVLCELYRVVRPGGRLVVADPDFETITIDSPDRVMTRKVLNFFCDFGRRQGWMGRQLPGIFRDMELKDIVTIPVTAIISDLSLADELFELNDDLAGMQERRIITADEGEHWMDDLRLLNESGKFFASASLFLVSGMKP